MADTEVVDVDASHQPFGPVVRKCALCFSEVTVKSEPFLLPCLHTACKACLPEDQSTVQCNHCDQIFPPSAAIRHLVLLDRLEKETPEEEDNSEESGPKNLCTSCDEGVAAGGYCKDCEEWLCAACIKAHQRVKVTKDHIILSTEQAGRALRAAAKQRFQMCEKHPKEPLKFYCSKCSALTCRDCQLEDHQNHGEYLALVAAWKQQESDFNTQHKRIAEKQAFIREYVASLEKWQDATTQVESKVVGDIRAYAVRAITLINAKAKKLIREIQDTCNHKREVLSYKRTEVLHLCKRLLDCHAIVDDMVSTGSELALMHSKQTMERRMSALIEKVVQLPSTKAEINLKFIFEPKVLDGLANTGQIIDLSSLRESAHSLRTQYNGQQSRPHSASGVLSNGRSAPSPALSSKSGSPHSLPGFCSSSQHPARPPSGPSLRDKEPRRPTPSPSPLENGSKDDLVITGDVEPPTGGRTAPSPLSVSSSSVTSASGGASVTASVSVTASISVSAVESTRLVSSADSQPPQATEPDTSAVPEDNDNSDDWCAVCHDGGELLCCGLCPKVYHLHCHVPSLVSTPSEDWKCTLCTPVQEDSLPAASKDGAGKRKIPVGLSGKQLKIAEKILLQLFCHGSSTPFQTPVSRTVPNYFKIITRPMDLSTVKQKLSASHFNHYESATAFIQDIQLIFCNCYTFNAKESPLAKQAQLLEQYFKQLIEKELPECIGDLKDQLEELDATKKAKVA